MSKHSIQINNELYSNILEFCKANNEKISVFCERILKDGLLREKYGDTPFATYETTIINNNPVSSLTRTVTIEKSDKDESIEIDKNVKTNSGTTHPSVIFIPYTIEDKTTLITNGDGNLNKKYIKTRVPSDFYGEIKTELESKTQKPKKRRL